jgi:signal transduction histidine kinase
LDQAKEKETEKYILANIDIASQNKEKDLLVNQLAFQEKEKNKQAAKLIMSYKELYFQMEEKGKRAAELIVANIELAFQNTEKEKRAEELVIANKELLFQNTEKEKRASELVIANRQLALQNEAEAKRAADLVLANIELIFQNVEKEKRAAELVVANRELIIQNEEKEKRAAELVVANKELKQFAYIASHDLQEPLRTISNYIEAFELEHFHLLGEDGKQYIRSINRAAQRMSALVEALLNFSRLGRDKKMTLVDCNKIINSVLEDLRALIKSSKSTITLVGIPVMNACEIEIRQLFQNLITNAIKFVKKDVQPKIQIRAVQLDEKWKFSVSDNGIGIDPIHFERVFDLFQRLHSHEKYAGNGIGLANCKKIVQLHRGEIWIESMVGQGTTFHFTIPC